MINLLVVNWTMSICRSDSFNYSIFQTLGTIDLITLWKEIRYAMVRFSFFVRVYPLNGCNTLHGGVSRYAYCISPGRVAWCACRYANTRDCCWHTDSCNCLYWFSLYKESAIYRQSLLLLLVIVHFGLLKVMTRKLTWVNMLIVGFGRFIYLSVIKVNLIMFRSMSGRTIGLPSASGRCVVSLFAHWHFPLLIS